MYESHCYIYIYQQKKKKNIIEPSCKKICFRVEIRLSLFRVIGVINVSSVESLLFEAGSGWQADLSRAANRSCPTANVWNGLSSDMLLSGWPSLEIKPVMNCRISFPNYYIFCARFLSVLSHSQRTRRYISSIKSLGSKLFPFIVDPLFSKGTMDREANRKSWKLSSFEKHANRTFFP